MKDIPIIIATHSRPKSLERLLISVQKASYPFYVKLIISIDGGYDPEVRKVAEIFRWRHGEKQIIVHPKNLGLKEHILYCGDMSIQHDGAIILEDDLYVSENFYIYALQAAVKYESEDKIAGISLYSHRYNETAQLPFIPLNDESDVYFLEYASSWGQCWLKNQWLGFRNWYEVNGKEKIKNNSRLPLNISLWPESSWKKYFILYLADTGRFFVFPREGLTTNFCEPGQHYLKKEYFLQVPLSRNKQQFIFKDFKDSYAVYDVFFEILPEKIKLLCSDIDEYDFETDLYGMKDLDAISKPYILSVKKCFTAVKTYALELKPMELNIIENIPGGEISLAKKDNFSDITFLEKIYKKDKLKDLLYHFGMRENHLNSSQSKLPRFVLRHPKLYKFMSKVYFALHRFKKKYSKNDHRINI